MQSFSPSPDLQSRVITHTERRIRQRRQAAVGVIVGSSVMLMVFGVILVNQNSSNDTEFAAASDPSAPVVIPTVAATQMATVPQTVPPTIASTTVPVTTATLLSPTTTQPLVVTSVVAPAATEVPFDGRSIAISHEDSLAQVAAATINELGVDIPIGDSDATALFPTFNFDPTGSGTVTVASPSDDRVMVAAPTGERWNYSLPPNDPSGRIWDAAVGPDGRLYVSRTSDEASTFTLVVHELDAANGRATEVLRHDTDWGCYESFCGGILFNASGVDVLDTPAETMTYADPAAGGRLLPQLTPDSPEWIEDERCQAAPDSGFFYGTVVSRITLNDGRHQFSVTCTGADAHMGTPFSVQADGSLIAFSGLTGPTSEDSPSGVVGHFRADGTHVSFEVGPKIVAVTYADGQYLGIEYYEDGSYGHWRLVKLNPAL